MSKEEIKILLVDDEKQFVDTLAERLAMRGFSARVAYDGPQALKAVEDPTDVIVLDLRMPGMDGFEVLRSVKKSNPPGAGHHPDRPRRRCRRTDGLPHGRLQLPQKNPWTSTSC